MKSLQKWARKYWLELSRAEKIREIENAISLGLIIWFMCILIKG